MNQYYPGYVDYGGAIDSGINAFFGAQKFYNDKAAQDERLRLAAEEMRQREQELQLQQMRQNALIDEMTAKRQAEAAALQRQQELAGQLPNIFAPKEVVTSGGPMRPERGGYTFGVGQRPVTQDEALGRILPFAGTPVYDDLQKQVEARFPKPPELTGDARNLEIILGRRPTRKELEDYKKSGGTNVTTIVPQGANTPDIVTPILKDLPAREQKALADRAAIERIDNMIPMLNKHGDDITGLSGTIKRVLAPYATMLGMNTEAMSDAQILESLLDTNAGSLRLEVVGPGPVSNYEQGILQGVSGKKISAAEGVRRILNYQRKTKKDSIDSHNKLLKNISGQKGYENITNIYSTVDIPSNENAVDLDKFWK